MEVFFAHVNISSKLKPNHMKKYVFKMNDGPVGFE